MKEPSVIIQMSAEATPSAAINSQDIAAGVVVAPCGTVETKLFNSSTEVLNEFTPTGRITRDTDTTVIHAAAIADIYPVLLQRSFDDAGYRAGVLLSNTTGGAQLMSLNALFLNGEQVGTVPSGTVQIPEGTGLSKESNYVLSIYATSPNSTDYVIEYFGPDSDNPELVNLRVITPSRTYDYSGSLDKNYLNAYGRNQFLGNINDYVGIPFQIEIPDGATIKSTDKWTNVPFGAIYVDMEAAAENATRTEALNKLGDQEDYKIAFLCPFGYANPSFVNSLTLLAEETWSFVPFGLMVNKNDSQVIVNAATGVKSEKCLIMAPNDKNQGLADFTIPLSLEVAYLQTIRQNAARGCKFAPVMGSGNGIFNITAPSVVLSKSTREALLDAKIMSLISKPAQGLHYLNKNKASTGETILSEEQNMRMACQINRDVTELLTPMLGRFNTQETRSLVVSLINTYFAQNILNQVYSIDSYRVVCDETNNPPEVRAANQLVVDITVTYLNAIYEVLVYHRALNVAQS